MNPSTYIANILTTNQSDYTCMGFSRSTFFYGFSLAWGQKKDIRNQPCFNFWTEDWESMLKYKCITASGSGFHQLLAASKKRRKTPSLPKVLEPPAYQASNKGAPSPRGARPFCQRGALHNLPALFHLSTLQPSFSWLPAVSE